MVFCDALGIKNPLGGTSKMRGYAYVQGGDKNSDVFHEVGIKSESAQKTSSVSARVKSNFGDVKPVTYPQSPFIQGLQFVFGVMLILVSIMSAAYFLRNKVLFLKPVGNFIASLIGN